ncbi:MAG: 2'-5' RNA ligase family protein [Chitinophagaceae bacterium]
MGQSRRKNEHEAKGINDADGFVQSMVSSGILREEWPEYRLVIPAEEPVSRQVCQLRREWEIQYGSENMQITEKPPNITMACLVMREEMEEMLLRWLQRLCHMQTSFRVTLNNFSAIPPQTVYIRVQDPVPFKWLHEQLRAMDRFFPGQEGQRPRIFEKPFIKMGSLTANTERKTIFAYTHQLFYASFMARRMLLLKSSGEEWKSIGIFPFRDE